MSNITVSVEWESSAIFAGEDVRCIITFTNATPVTGRLRSTLQDHQSRGFGSNRERWISDLVPRELPTSPNRPSLPKTETSLQCLSGHRSTSSLSGTSTSKIGGTSPSTVHSTNHSKSITGVHKHQRSVSIVSLGGIGTIGDEKTLDNHISLPQSISRRHGRAASFQDVTHYSGGPFTGSARSKAEPTGSLSSIHSTQPVTVSPISISSTHTVEPRASEHTISAQPLKSTMDVAIREKVRARGFPNGATSPLAKFRFPRQPSSSSIVEEPLVSTSTKTGKSSNAPQILVTKKPRENTHLNDPNRPIAGSLPPASINGTPRSSIDLYSASNNSAETLASEYTAPIINRQSSRPQHGRQLSHLAPISSHGRRPEALIMGYVQLVGSFTLDGSLVKLAPFEDIKRKGVIGGQGSGGVVGVELAKKDSSLFGTLGWGNIGESLGNILGGGEPSSIREMKGVAKMRSVPILSTPQSILFVDLKLDPGENKSFEYVHMLPKGIPPTHKGRAIKITYNLVVGTQRAQVKAQQHSIRHVDIPFRVLPSVNGLGDILGHDLMSPHITLQDKARTRSIDNHSQSPRGAFNDGRGRKSVIPDEFTKYVQSILVEPQHDYNLGPLSLTDSVSGTQPDFIDDMVSTKDIIDYAISRGSSLSPSQLSHRRFQIHRSGVRVAVILLARPAYRLGETVYVIVDFEDAVVQCHSLHVSLETSEVIDPAITLRSNASIQRATRKVHGATSEVTVSTQRAIFTSTIPPNATPDFITSGVSLEWKLRFEFVTSRSTALDRIEGELTEEVMADDRGKVLAAVEIIPCESFDVAIPLRVYGALGPSDAGAKVGGFSI